MSSDDGVQQRPSPTSIQSRSAERLWSVGSIRSLILSHLEPGACLPLLCLSRAAFPDVVAAMYHEIDVEIYLHLSQCAIPWTRLRLYTESVRELDLTESFPLRLPFTGIPHIFQIFQRLLLIKCPNVDIYSPERSPSSLHIYVWRKHDMDTTARHAIPIPFPTSTSWTFEDFYGLCFNSLQDVIEIESLLDQPPAAWPALLRLPCSEMVISVPIPFNHVISILQKLDANTSPLLDRLRVHAVPTAHDFRSFSVGFGRALTSLTLGISYRKILNLPWSLLPALEILELEWAVKFEEGKAEIDMLQHAQGPVRSQSLPELSDITFYITYMHGVTPDLTQESSDLTSVVRKRVQFLHQTLPSCQTLCALLSSIGGGIRCEYDVRVFPHKMSLVTPEECDLNEWGAVAAMESAIACFDETYRADFRRAMDRLLYPEADLGFSKMLKTK